MDERPESSLEEIEEYHFVVNQTYKSEMKHMSSITLMLKLKDSVLEREM
jgi:hypothetical protein